MFAKIGHLYQSLKLLFVCAAYVLVRGRARKVPQNISTVAVTQVAKVGDMVLVTPLFRALKKKYPHAHVIVVGGEGGKRVLENNPDVDEVIVYRNDPFALARVLKSKHIDFVAITNPGPEMLVAFFLAGVPCISAFTLMPSDRFYVSLDRLYQILKHLVIVKPLRIGEYMPKQSLDLLEPIGIKGADTHLRLGYSEEAVLATRKQLREQGIALGEDLVVAVAPGGKEIRQWPADRFAKLINHLHRCYGAKIVLVGAGQDGEAIEAVINELGENHGVIYVNELDQSLDELKALIAQADILVSNDSGPVAFAEAFDTPSVMVVGPTDEKEHHYEDSIHKMIVASTRGRPITYARNWFNYDRDEAFRQIRAVSYEQVREAVDTLLTNRERKEKVVK